MGKGLLFITWICTFTVIASGTKDDDRIAVGQHLFKGLSTDIQKELGEYMLNIMEEYQQNMLTGNAHQVYEFRVLIPKNSHQCYYQEAENRTSLLINYECVNSPSVSRNGKVSAQVFLTGDDMGLIESNEAAKSGDFDIEVKKKGTYAICFDNEDTQSFAIVQIQIDLWNHEEQLKFHKEKKDEDVLYQSNLRVFQVARSIAIIRHAIKHTQSLLYYDYLTVVSNQSRVNNFSLLSFVLIASVCFIQLRVVKRMFGNQTSNV